MAMHSHSDFCAYGLAWLSQFDQEQNERCSPSSTRAAGEHNNLRIPSFSAIKGEPPQSTSHCTRRRVARLGVHDRCSSPVDS